MTPQRLIVPVLAVLFGGLLTGRVDASVIVSTNHITDGQFGQNEWTGTHVVTPTFFPVVGDTGGAYLYADQGLGTQAGNLYLMYDYVNSPITGFGQANSFFDVFFQVDSDHTDYVAHFASDGQVSLFEKPTGTLSQENPDGTLNLSSPPWTLDSSSDPDFVKANFHAAIGFGASPNSATNHLIAEFQLTIDTSLFPGNSGPSTGLYSPDPAFWSASVGPVAGVALDPPISSAIFQLNPDGSTTITPVLGPNGGPVLQPQDGVPIPEPSSLALLGIGVATVLAYRRWRQD
jgi:hypothetical protein